MNIELARLLELGIVFFVISLLFWGFISWPVGYYRTYRIVPLLISFVEVSIIGSIYAAVLAFLLIGKIPREALAFILLVTCITGGMLFGWKWIFPRLWKPKQNQMPLQTKPVNWGESISMVIGIILWLIIVKVIFTRYFAGQNAVRILVIVGGIYIFSRIARMVWRYMRDLNKTKNK